MLNVYTFCFTNGEWVKERDEVGRKEGKGGGQRWERCSRNRLVGHRRHCERSDPSERFDGSVHGFHVFVFSTLATMDPFCPGALDLDPGALPSLPTHSGAVTTRAQQRLSGTTVPERTKRCKGKERKKTKKKWRTEPLWCFYRAALCLLSLGLKTTTPFSFSSSPFSSSFPSSLCSPFSQSRMF